jgi:large subunit ribosomal protein L4
VNPHLLHETVRWHLAGLRRGTHKVKGRGEVRGSGRKLWRQKGTGRARVGSVRSPIWRHGGTVHGPVPRDYSYRIPRKVFLGALRSALSAKLAEEKLIVVESWELESHKTKPFRQALDRLESRTTALLVSHATNRNLELASRNLEGVKLVTPKALQAYDLLRHDRLMLSKETALHLGQALGSGAGATAAPAAGEPRPAKPAPAATGGRKLAKSGRALKPRAPRKAPAKSKAKE